MTLKNKGYLLVDLSIAISIFSILSFGIFTFYKTYKRIDTENKRNIEYLNYMNYVYSEIKYNLTFDEILELGLDKEYVIDISKNKLNADLFNNFEKNFKGGKKEVFNKEYIAFTVKDNKENILNINIKFINSSSECIYENTIKKYRFLL